MKQILNKILSPQWFAIGYLPWLAINMTTVINVMDFTRWVLIAFAVWAVAISVKTYLFSGIAPWLQKGQALLLGFLAACLLSQVLQFSYGGADALGKLCYFALCLLILYPQHGSGLAEYRQTIGIVARVMGVIIGIMMAVSDWMFFTLYSAKIAVRSGGNPHVGFAENRLYGIFSSPNVGATYALLLIWCSLLVLFWSKNMRCKTLWRVLAVVQIVLATVFVSVALSKGSYVLGAVLLASLLILNLPRLKDWLAKRWKWLDTTIGKVTGVSVGIVGVLVALVICYVGVNLVNKGAVRLMVWNQQRQMQTVEPSQDPATPPTDSSEGDELSKQNDKTQQIIDNALQGFNGRVEAGRDDIDFTNKRATIWKSHLKLLEGKHWLIGVNRPRAYMEANPDVRAGLAEDQVSEIQRADGNLHCGYLQILINHGLLALLPMLAFLAWCAFRVLRFFSSRFGEKAKPDSDAYEIFAWTLPVVLAILANNVFETNFVLMGANFFSAFFWFAAGACVLSMRKGAKN